MQYVSKSASICKQKRLQTWPKALGNRKIPETNFFLKQKNSQPILFKKNLDQSDSCGFSSQLRVFLKTLLYRIKTLNIRESAILKILIYGSKNKIAL